MLCRVCQDSDPRGIKEERRATLRDAPQTPEKRPEKPPETLPEKPKTRGRVRDQLCSRCGHLLGPEDMEKRVKDKQSQLARFGLAGKRGALLKRKRRDDS